MGGALILMKKSIFVICHLSEATEPAERLDRETLERPEVRDLFDLGPLLAFLISLKSNC